MNVYKQIEVIVCYAKITMEYILILCTGESTLHNDKHVANGGHLSCDGNHTQIHCSRKLCKSMYI